MSRLTSKAPFNRPSVFDVLPPRPVPLSPPETEMETSLPQPQPQDDIYVEPQQSQVESPVSRFRRASNVVYNSSGLLSRDSRPVQRQSKWLIMVFPPASLTHEPPVLGHTLSSAPPGRFSGGILMPLFPTLYAQVTAIAREFNIPSTTGLCVYLQLSEGTTPMVTPRISDETWQILWGHFFSGDDRTAPFPSHGLPICGRIEFDIDVRRARWFDSWMGHSRRPESEAMSREPSVVPTHWRGDSRTSIFPLEHGGEESLTPPDTNPPPNAISSRIGTQRNLPRALFLERRDMISVKSSRHPSRVPSISHESPSPEAVQQTAVTPTPPTEPTFIPKALSPVVQEQEEPLTAKKAELDTLVLQWRKSSSMIGGPSSALSAAGQPSLDPVNMPSGANVDLELDLNDFAWSISSAGPPSESPTSPEWPEPNPSVHLLERLQGSVCLTPTTCTSFGPLDDWPTSPVSNVSRRPSPDLGFRMLDYAPLTPSTATSWGPEDLPSPVQSEFDSASRAPSVDIGIRGMGSRPATPSTATSWGPVSPLMPLPATPLYTRTPDSGERAFSDFEARRRTSTAFVFPYYNAWEAEPWRHIWPYLLRRGQDNALITLSTPMRRVGNKGLRPEWPDFAALYPSHPSIERAAANKSQPVELPGGIGYPIFELYPAVYPYNLERIYPTASQTRSGHLREPVPCASEKDHLLQGLNLAPLYPSDLPVGRIEGNHSLSIALPGSVIDYPSIHVYPPVYPHNLEEIYPAAYEVLNESVSAPAYSVPEGGSLPEWPDFASLYPSDPKVPRPAANKAQPVALSGSVLNYPLIEIYPPAYPYNLDRIYPIVLQYQGSDPLMPINGMYRKKLLPEWPDFASLYSPDPKMEPVAVNKSQLVALPGPVLEYPLLRIYPAVYPYNLNCIYPSVLAPRSFLRLPDFESQPLQHQESNSFFASHITPYPHNLKEIYPAVHPALSDTNITCVTDSMSQTIGLPAAGYPNLLIYPPVYPWNLAQIYAPNTLIEHPSEGTITSKALSVRLPSYSGYPNFNLYPAASGYPVFEIYPPVLPLPSSLATVPSVKLFATYPVIEIYEPVYPHLVVYPPVQLDVTVPPPGSISLRKRAPTPAPSRHRQRGSGTSFTSVQAQDELRRLSRSPVQKDLASPSLPKSPARLVELPVRRVSIPRKPRRTHLDLHRAVFGIDGDCEASADGSESSQLSRPRRKPRRTHHELHQIAFSNLIQSSQGEDLVPELPSRSVTPSSRQRSRSGTMSRRPSLPPASTASSLVSPPPPNGPRARWPSVSTNVIAYNQGTSSSPSGKPPSDPLPPLPNTPSPVRIRIQSPIMPGRQPLSSAPSGASLNRVRSMNTPVRPDPSTPLSTVELRGLDRSRSMSDAQSGRPRRQSVVLERARMFTLSEHGVDVNVLTDLPSPSKNRAVSKLDRSKFPFA